MIKCFIPSFNRACQLQLLLSTMHDNASGLFQPVINYDYSEQEFAEGYDKLRNSKLGKMCIWDKRDIYGLDFKSFLEANENDIVGHFVDDMIYYRKTTVTEQIIRDILTNQSVWCFNFRVGLNINITDYQIQKPISLPSGISINNNYIRWNYRDQIGSMWDSYFNFEACVDGFVFRPSDILWLLSGEEWANIKTPMDYEHLSCHNGMRNNHNKEYMASPVYSEVFAQHINSGYNANHKINKVPYNLYELNRKYINGYVIDFNSMDFSNINCAHDEINFKFKEIVND